MEGGAPASPMEFDAVLSKISKSLDQHARSAIKSFLRRTTPSKNGGSGPLSAQELVNVFVNMDVELSEQEIQFVMDEMGVDTISFEQLLQVADVLSEVDAATAPDVEDYADNNDDRNNARPEEAVQTPQREREETDPDFDQKTIRGIIDGSIANPIRAHDEYGSGSIEETRTQDVNTASNTNGNERFRELSDEATSEDATEDLDPDDEEQMQRRLTNDMKHIEFPWNYNDVGIQSDDDDNHNNYNNNRGHLSSEPSRSDGASTASGRFESHPPNTKFKTDREMDARPREFDPQQHPSLHSNVAREPSAHSDVDEGNSVGDISPINPVVYEGGGDDGSPVWSHVARRDAQDAYKATRSTVEENEDMLRSLLKEVDAKTSEAAQAKLSEKEAALLIQRTAR